MAEKRIVYFISDRTGITAEALGKSLLTQFDHIEFERHTLPFIDTPKRAAAALDWINHSTQESGQRPIVFSTLMNQEVRAIVANANALFIDFFATFITPLETEFSAKSSGAIGKAHGMGNDYLGRMNGLSLLEEDSPTSRSLKVRNSGSTNATPHLTIAKFQVCDVMRTSPCLRPQGYESAQPWQACLQTGG